MKSLIFFKILPLIVIVICMSSYASYLYTGKPVPLPLASGNAALFSWSNTQAKLGQYKDQTVSWVLSQSNKAKAALFGASPTGTKRAETRFDNPAAKQVVFRWHSADGSVAYGDTPPQHIEKVELLKEDDLQPLMVLSKEAFTLKTMTSDAVVTSGNKASSNQAESARNTPELTLIEKANAAKQMMEQRYREQQAVFDGVN